MRHTHRKSLKRERCEKVARSSTKRVGVSMKFLRRAADNARCGLVRLRRTTMQSKILDPACAPKMKAKWKMKMLDIMRIRKGEWTRFLAVFPIRALQELNSLDESNI